MEFIPCSTLRPEKQAEKSTELRVEKRVCVLQYF